MIHRWLYQQRSLNLRLDSPSPDWLNQSMEQSSSWGPNHPLLVNYFALPHQVIWFHPVGFNYDHLRRMVIIHWKGGLRSYFSIEYGRTQLPWFYISAQCFHHWGHSSRKKFWGFYFLLGPCALIVHYSMCPLKDFLRTIHWRPWTYAKQHNSYRWKCHY